MEYDREIFTSNEKPEYYDDRFPEMENLLKKYVSLGYSYQSLLRHLYFTNYQKFIEASWACDYILHQTHWDLRLKEETRIERLNDLYGALYYCCEEFYEQSKIEDKEWESERRYQMQMESREVSKDGKVIYVKF